MGTTIAGSFLGCRLKSSVRPTVTPAYFSDRFIVSIRMEGGGNVVSSASVDENNLEGIEENAFSRLVNVNEFRPCSLKRTAQTSIFPCNVTYGKNGGKHREKLVIRSNARNTHLKRSNKRERAISYKNKQLSFSAHYSVYRSLLRPATSLDRRG